MMRLASTLALITLLLMIGGSRASIIPNSIENDVNDNSIDQCNLPEALRQEIAGYQPTVDRIYEAIVHGRFSGDTYESLQNFTDKFGARLAGSKILENAIDYLQKEFGANSLENVHTEEAPVPHWVRGFESAELVYPRKVQLPFLGLGRTIGTPPEGISADVVAVETFEELHSLPDDFVKGKIVVYAQKWTGYGSTVQYRSQGAIEAAKKGAVAALVKSVTPFSIGSPHTGTMSYQEGVPQIPSCCLTVEDANMILRLSRIGRVTINLTMKHKNLPMTTSRNLIGEFVGQNGLRNKSVVLVSGHIDSWDVGVGAMDDGGGAFISWKALQYLKALGLQPKRTLRAVLWTAEEFGMYGARQYEKNHMKTEKEEFNFMMESDMGVFTPLGLGVSGSPDVKCILKEVLKLMTPLNATQFQDGADVPDLNSWIQRGFPGASLLNANEKYFWYHHSAGDRMEVMNSTDLDKGTALFAATAYIVADLSIDMPKTVF